MKEIWKDIEGYEGLYQVSNLGRVKSFRGSTKFGKPKELILKPSLINSGYHVVTLYYGNQKKRKFQVHRLVAETFIDNPEHLPCVNHKDENKLNNCVSNLEWCTYQYNNNYGTAKMRMRKTLEEKGKSGSIIGDTKKVKQKTLDGNLLAVYSSSTIAAELLNYKVSTIRTWCRVGMGGGYRWEYENQI